MSSDVPGDQPRGAKVPDVHSALDDCHRLTLAALDRLEAMLPRIEAEDISPGLREMAADIVHHFSVTVRQHHQDEERDVFPPLAASSNPEVVQAVLMLQQDHAWLEEDWMEIAPHLDAVASGQSWYDVDVLREGISIFAALSRDHIAFEESLFYPELQAHLRCGGIPEGGREIAARRRAERRLGDDAH